MISRHFLRDDSIYLLLLQENKIDAAKSINYFLICILFKKNMRQKGGFWLLFTAIFIIPALLYEDGTGIACYSSFSIACTTSPAMVMPNMAGM